MWFLHNLDWNSWESLQVCSGVNENLGVEATGLTFGLNLHIHPYFVYAHTHTQNTYKQLRQLV